MEKLEQTVMKIKENTMDSSRDTLLIQYDGFILSRVSKDLGR